MRYSRIIIFLLILPLAIFLAAEIRAAEMDSSKTPGHTMFVLNHYQECVQLTQVCVYFFKDLDNQVCGQLSDGHMSFSLPAGVKWNQLQRITLLGKNLKVPGEQLACVAYQDYKNDSFSSLENILNITLQINHVGHHFMVCSLLNSGTSDN